MKGNKPLRYNEKNAYCHHIIAMTVAVRSESRKWPQYAISDYPCLLQHAWSVELDLRRNTTVVSLTEAFTSFSHLATDRAAHTRRAQQWGRLHDVDEGFQKTCAKQRSGKASYTEIDFKIEDKKRRVHVYFQNIYKNINQWRYFCTVLRHLQSICRQMKRILKRQMTIRCPAKFITKCHSNNPIKRTNHFLHPSNLPTRLSSARATDRLSKPAILFARIPVHPPSANIPSHLLQANAVSVHPPARRCFATS